MITVECDRLQSRIEEFHRRKTAEKHRQAIAARRHIFEGFAARLGEHVSTLRVLRDAGLSVAIQEANVANIAREVAELQRRYSANPDSVAESGAMPDIKRFMGALLNSLAEEIASAWRAYADEHIERRERVLLDVLSHIPDFATTIREIVDLGGKLQTAREHPPRDRAEYDAFHARIEKERRLWGGLQAGSMPDAVVAFLRTAGGHGGASLDLLTPEVMDWLATRGVKGSFHVVIRS